MLARQRVCTTFSWALVSPSTANAEDLVQFLTGSRGILPRRIAARYLRVFFWTQVPGARCFDVQVGEGSELGLGQIGGTVA